MKKAIYSLMALTLALAAVPCRAQENRISLAECIEMSHSANPEVLNSVLDTRIAKAKRQEVLSLWFPSLSASAYGMHANDHLLKIKAKDILGDSDAANNLIYYLETSGNLAGVNTQIRLLQSGYLASLNLSQPVFAGGRIANGNSLAKLGVKAARLKSEMALRNNDDEVARKYWLAVTLGEKRKALQQAIDLVASLEQDVVSATDAGLARGSDLLQVRLKAKELSSAMVQLKSGEKLAKMDLFNYIGYSYNTLTLDKDVLSDGFESLLAPENYYRDQDEMASSLAENKLLEMSVKAKQIEKKMAIGEGLPEIGIGASVNYHKVLGAPEPGGIVFAMVKIPLSDWGRTARKIQQCNFEVEKAENDRAYLSRQLRLKVDKEWIDLETAWNRILSEEDAVELYKTVELQKRKEFEAGLCTLSDLLQCQTELQSARSNLVEAKAGYCTALAQWIK